MAPSLFPRAAVVIAVLAHVSLAFAYKSVSSDASRDARVVLLEASSKSLLEAYDGAAIQRRYSARPCLVLQRLIRVGVPLANWYATVKLDNATRLYRTDSENYLLVQRRAKELREAIIGTGSVTFIKSGQALALRPDLIKVPEYIRELEKLQDEVGNFPNSVAMRIIEKELGQKADEIYEFEYPDPVASASIGQVYKARLKSSGKPVAVKVQRPEAFDSAGLDMFILRNLADFWKKWKKLRSNLVGVADEFGQQLFGELDYIQEAYNCQRFKHLYGKIPNIFVPDVYLDYTSRRVLTQEWVEGDKGPWPEDGERLLTVGIQCSVLQLLESGFFHADPHRGNLLRTPDGKLAYLDFGMMANVTATNRFGLITAILGLQNKNVAMIATSLKTLGFLPEETNLDVLIPALDEAVSDASNGSASKLNFTRLNENLQNISFMLPFRIPPFYSLIVRTLTILEGLAFTVDPNFRLVKGAYPFIAKQILTSPSPELKELLQQVLITPSGGIDWVRLEQLVSISNTVSSAKYQNIKKAQDRSDLQRIYLGEEEKTNFTLEVTLDVVNFLMGEHGAFLREALVKELVDTIDSLQLATASAVSLLSGGFIERPAEMPDRQRVTTVLNLSRSLIQQAFDKANTGRDPTNLMAFISSTQSLVLEAREPAARTLLLQLSRFALQVLGVLVERNAQRLTREGLRVLNLRQTLPAIARLLDFIPVSSHHKEHATQLAKASASELVSKSGQNSQAPKAK